MLFFTSHCHYHLLCRQKYPTTRYKAFHCNPKTLIFPIKMEKAKSYDGSISEKVHSAHTGSISVELGMITEYPNPKTFTSPSTMGNSVGIPKPIASKAAKIHYTSLSKPGQSKSCNLQTLTRGTQTIIDVPVVMRHKTFDRGTQTSLKEPFDKQSCTENDEIIVDQHLNVEETPKESSKETPISSNLSEPKRSCCSEAICGKY